MKIVSGLILSLDITKAYRNAIKTLGGDAKLVRVIPKKNMSFTIQVGPDGANLPSKFPENLKDSLEKGVEWLAVMHDGCLYYYDGEDKWWGFVPKKTVDSILANATIKTSVKDTAKAPVDKPFRMSIYDEQGFINLNNIPLTPYSKYGYETIKKGLVLDILKKIIGQEASKAQTSFNSRFKPLLFEEATFGNYTNKIGSKSASFGVAKRAFEALFDFIKERYGVNIIFEENLSNFTDLSVAKAAVLQKKEDPRLSEAKKLLQKVNDIQSKINELDDLMYYADKEADSLMGGGGLGYKGNQLYTLRKIKIPTEVIQNFIKSLE